VVISRLRMGGATAVVGIGVWYSIKRVFQSLSKTSGLHHLLEVCRRIDDEYMWQTDHAPGVRVLTLIRLGGAHSDPGVAQMRAVAWIKTIGRKRRLRVRG
jgi:hypothetical protein